MGWDGNGVIDRTDGTRTGSTVWADALAADEDVNAQDHDTHDEDLANAVQNCIAKDGQNTPTQNLPMGGKKHTGAGAATANGQYVIFNQFAWTSWTPTITPGGSMTYASSSIAFAKYIQINKMVWIKISFTGTVGGTPNNTLKFSLPVTNNGDAVGGSGVVLDNGSLVGAFATYASTTEFDIYRYDSGVYTAGTVTPTIHMCYEAA